MSDCCAPVSASEPVGTERSVFDVDRCTKAFASVDEARDFMLAKDYDGHVLLRGDGTFTAVCPTYPDGFYPDATIVATVGSEPPNMAASSE